MLAIIDIWLGCKYVSGLLLCLHDSIKTNIINERFDAILWDSRYI